MLLTRLMTMQQEGRGYAGLLRIRCGGGKKKGFDLSKPLVYGGGLRIRTLGGDKPSTVFKTAAFDHSASPPENVL